MIRRPTVHRLFDLEGEWFALSRRWNTGDAAYKTERSVADIEIRKELGAFIASLQVVESELKALETSEGFYD